MAGEQTKAYIEAQRKAGKSDIAIFNSMIDIPKFKAGIEQGNKLGHTNRQIAQGLGLNISSQPVDLDKVKKDAMLAEGKKAGKTNTMDSVAMGLTGGIGGGAAQGFYKLIDLVAGGANKVIGRDYLPTNQYKKFTQQRQDFADLHNAQREANDQGFDWVQLGTGIASEAPLAVLGRGYQGAKILSKAGAKVTGQNALVGAGIGGSSFAGDVEQRLSNTVLSGLGGAAGAAVGEKIGQGLGKAIQTGKNTASKFSTTQTNQFLSQINQKLDDALNQHGMSLGDLSNEVVSSLRKDALKAFQSGKNLNADAIARKAVLDKLGLKGTKAQVSGDAKEWQQQAELAKINGAGDPLREKFIDDNVQLTRLLNEASDTTKGTSVDSYEAMDSALKSIQDQLGQNKEYIRTAYNSARQAQGNDVKLGGADFVQEANKALKDSYATMELPASIRSILKRFEKKPDEFTLGESEAVIKKLNQAHQASLKIDGTPSSETYAIGLVRDVLNNRQNTTLQNLASQNNPAAELYQLGRQAHGFNANQIESMPLLQDAVKGVEPDKLFNKHILGGNVNELDKTIQILKNVSPQSVNDIKQQVVEFISKKAINSNGQFSPSGMKGALDKLTDRRMLTMFSPKEFSQIKDISKAADYLISQPPHSYVNNSNTSATLANHFLGLLKLPGARIALSAVKDVPDSIAVSKAMQPSIAGEAIPISQGTQDLIERLTRAGLISGSNLPNQ
ncbi:hypothetical protein [Acinetobacter wuhouensis]|uniref:Uncharacterized protein n=1 Tax=Acinetobacter wuhouensis TaxID=1879050 RepID=A0A4Q7AH21_9GAMM|nr:hypothetical protein [Acinetobacter wuhouensis]RZG47043.1 hypothetical protein EXU28_07605 [Acinetobacter wuhouensis]